MSRSVPPSADPSFPAYGQTVLHFANGPVTDLRSQPRRAHVDRLHALGLGATFAVITAHNPLGSVLPVHENAARHDRLLRELKGLPQHGVAGCSPDGKHCEDSIAVALPLPEAQATAARHGQTALFWFDGSAFILMPAAADFPPVPLPASVEDLQRIAARRAG